MDYLSTSAAILKRLRESSKNYAVSEEDLFRAVAPSNTTENYNTFLDTLEVMKETMMFEARVSDGQIWYRGMGN